MDRRMPIFVIGPHRMNVWLVIPRKVHQIPQPKTRLPEYLQCKLPRWSCQIAHDYSRGREHAFEFLSRNGAPLHDAVNIELLQNWDRGNPATSMTKTNERHDARHHAIYRIRRALPCSTFVASKQPFLK